MRRAWLIVILALACGAVTGQTPPDQIVEIRVAQGDTLATIAKTYLANPADWREIVRINRLSDPNRIAPGQVLIIPVRLLRDAPTEGVVEFLRGTAEVQAPGSADWKPLALKSRIAEGSQVRTSEASVLEITFENGDSCLLRPQTRLGFPALRRQGGSIFKRFYLQAGKVVTRIRKATGAESRTEIQTPSAQCAARGTVFRTSTGADGTSRAEVLEGTVAVEAMRTRVDVPIGFGTAVRRDEAPLPPKALLPGPQPAGLEAVYRSLPFSLRLDPPTGTVSITAALTKDREGRDVACEAGLRPGDPFRIESVPDGLYYLQAGSFDDLGLEGLPTEPVEIRVRTRPAPPAFAAPLGGFRRQPGELQLAWPKPEGAAGYRIQVAADQDFAKIVSERDETGPVSSLPLPATGQYYLRARSVAADGFESAWSPAVLVTVIPPLAAPVLEKPRVKGTRVFLRWTHAGTGPLFRCRVAGDSQFRLIIHDALIPTKSLDIPRPPEPGTYYVQVTALDGQGGESPASDVQTFKVGRGIAAWCKPCFILPLVLLLILIL